MLRRNPPKIGVLLRSRELRLLERATAGAFHIVGVSEWGDLHLAIKRAPLRMILVDPVFHGFFDEPAVVRLMTLYPFLPLVVYVKTDAAAFRGIAKLSRAGLEHVVIDSFDDSPEQLGGLVRRLCEDPLAAAVIARIRDQLRELPLVLAVTVEDLFESPEQFHSAFEVARESGIPMARVYRSLEVAGLRSPKSLLLASRALRAYSYLRNPGHMVQDVSGKLGYFQPRILSKHFHEVFGLNPGHSRQRLSAAEAVDRLVKFIRTDPAVSAPRERMSRRRRLVK